MRRILLALLIGLVLGTTAWGDMLVAGPPGSPFLSGSGGRSYTIREFGPGELVVKDLGVEVWSGDVALTEPGTRGGDGLVYSIWSDVLRFQPHTLIKIGDDTIGWVAIQAYLYSDPYVPVGLLEPNVTIPEVQLSPGVWGAIYSASNEYGTNTYTIISDTPEPATLLLFGSALSLIAGRLRRSRA